MSKQAGVVGGTAANGEQTRKLLIKITTQIQSTQVAGAGLGVKTTTQNVGNSARLFHDFLEQKMLIAALLDSLELELNFVLLVLAVLSLKIDYPILAAGLANSDLVVVQIHHAVGVPHYGRGVAGQKQFVFANANEQWAAPTCRHDLIRLALIEH